MKLAATLFAIATVALGRWESNTVVCIVDPDGKETPIFTGSVWRADNMKSNAVSAVIDDDTIRRLVSNGEVCRVIGHKWESVCSVGPGCLVIHTGPIRHCVICGKEERQSLGPWE